ncbi:MAG: ATP-binding protein [Leptothrix sp. (in: b-proteobacteria)]
MTDLPSRPPLNASPDASAAPRARAGSWGGYRIGRRWRRIGLWVTLGLLVIVGETSLWWLTWQHERNRLQEDTDQAAMQAAADVRQRLSDASRALQGLLWSGGADPTFPSQAEAVLRQHTDMARIELRSPDFVAIDRVLSPLHPTQFNGNRRAALVQDTEAACVSAQRLSAPVFSHSYFVPTQGGLGVEVIDLCVAQQEEGRVLSLVVGTLVLSDLLDQAVPASVRRTHDVLLVEADGTRLAHADSGRGHGVYRAERLVDKNGFTALLRLDSVADPLPPLANLSLVLVLGLSVALGAVMLMLVHDVRRRAVAEQGLAESLAFRKAMEDSLVTGLRARDRDGRITYVNPAFCQLVGWSADELRASIEPPYWPPQMADEYRRRQAKRLSLGEVPPREGHETVFMRRNGECVPVLVFEAPLVDGHGEHAGWMSAVLDLSAQRQAEALSRQQQDKLQAAARLATMGEMASLLSHELNQPLAAIASYASGSLNLLPGGAHDAPADLDTQLMIRQALTRVAEQAERAGRVIRSVHQFVRRRDRLRENLRVGELFEAVLPLARLAGLRSQVVVDVQLGEPMPRVSCDRTMVEQVLLNLARNGIQAMEADTAEADRRLTLGARALDERWVELSVTDLGPGIAPDVAERLFTPFFTTKAEGMGIGLSMCRTVVEQHGGTLAFASGPGVRGTSFRFTLPAAGATPPIT